MSDLINKAWRVTAWRESVPTTPWSYEAKRLVPGEQVAFTEHRIKFKITRGSTGKKAKPNACDLTIYNLSTEMRAEMEATPLKVQIEAGYDNAPRLMFIGDLRYGGSQLKNTTWETWQQLGDGARTYAHARVSRSYKQGTTYRTVVADAAKSMGLALPANLASNHELDRTFEAGTCMHGYTRDELTRVLAPFGYKWSIENGVLRVLRDDEVVHNMAIPIDVTHGMIDSPSWDTAKYAKKAPILSVKTLLYPEIVPGDLIQLTSQVKSGLFRAVLVEHEGDSHTEGSWTTALKLRPHQVGN